MCASPVGRRRICVKNVVLPFEIAHVFHCRNTLGRSKVANPASVFILVFQRAFTDAAEVPRNVREQPSAVGFARGEDQAGFAGLFMNDLSVFRKLLQRLRIDRKPLFVDQSGFTEQLDIDVHAEHIAVARKTVDTSVLIGKHLHIGRTEFIKHTDFCQRIRHVADQVLTDQKLRICKRRLENARRGAALCHRNIVAQ